MPQTSYRWIDGEASIQDGQVTLVIRNIDPQIFQRIHAPNRNADFLSYDSDFQGYAVSVDGIGNGIEVSNNYLKIMGDYQNYPTNFPQNFVVANRRIEVSNDQLVNWINGAIARFNAI